MTVFKKYMVGLLFVSLATAAKPTYEEELRGLPPMPERPTVNGIRFSFYHTLENLLRGAEDWFNPHNKKNYLYRSTPELALDTSAVFEAHVQLYQRLHKGFAELNQSGEIARYARLNAEGPEDGLVPVPPEWYALLSAGEYLQSAAFRNHYSMSQLLTILNKQLWDHRFISQLWFTTTVERGHRPLESVQSLSRSSERTQKLVDRWLGHLTRSLLYADQAMLAIADSALKGDLRYFEERLTLAKIESEKSNIAVSLLVDSIYKSVQFANDTVRDRKLGYEGLKKIVAKLGDDLRETLDEVDHFTKEKKRPNKDRLLDATAELRKIYGLDGFESRTMSWELRRRGPGFPEEVVKETAILQHILTVGSLLAKVSEIPEGRGPLGARILQELSFQRARLSSLASPSPSLKNESHALMPFDRRFKAVSAVQRRNFASPALASVRSRIEEELWAIFFEHAKLERHGQAQSECMRLLAAPSEPR